MGTDGTKKKIVYLSTAHPAMDPRIFFKEALTASRHGHRVCVIAPHERTETLHGIRILHLGRWTSRILRSTLAAARAFIIAAREGADLYHFHDAELLPWCWALQVLTRRPAVFDMHEYYAESIRSKQWILRPLRRPIAWMYDRVEALLLKRMAGVITVNEDLADRVRRRGGNVLVAPNYPRRDIFEDSVVDEEVLARYEDRRVVVYVGGLSEERGISRAIEVTARLRNNHPDALMLFVGGFGCPEYRRIVDALVDRLKVRDHVEFVGRVPHTEVPSYLAAAEVALFLLQPVNVRYEWGEPIKYFEYTAAGLPIVVSDLPAKRRLAERIGNGVVVDPLNAEEIAQAISSLLQDPKRRQSMGEEGRKAFLETYNWDHVGKTLLRWYAEVGGWCDGQRVDSGATYG